MVTSQMGGSLTLRSYEGLRPALPSRPSMASSSVTLKRFPCTMFLVRAATSVAPKVLAFWAFSLPYPCICSVLSLNLVDSLLVLQFSTLKPLGDRVLIKLKNAEEKTQGGILLPSTTQKRPKGGEVVALGDAKNLDKMQVPLSVQVHTLYVRDCFVWVNNSVNRSV